jgi:hypothetical protein
MALEGTGKLLEGSGQIAGTVLLVYAPAEAAVARSRAGVVATRGTAGAESTANAVRLRNRLAAREIASGHAFEKHVLQQGEFRGLGIRTRAQFQQHVDNVLSSPTGARYYRDGRVAYLHEPTGTVLIRNWVSGESTAFQPANWTEYLATRLPTRTTPYP